MMIRVIRQFFEPDIVPPTPRALFVMPLTLIWTLSMALSRTAIARSYSRSSNEVVGDNSSSLIGGYYDFSPSRISLILAGI